MEKVNQNLDRLQIVIFKVDNNQYGVNILKVKEIITEQEVMTLPNAPKAIKGVFNYRGDVITLIDLYEVLNLEKKKEAPPFILVLNFNDKLISFGVDQVVGTKTYDWNSITPISEVMDTSDKYYTGIINEDGNMVILLDFESIAIDLGQTGIIDTSTGNGHKRVNKPDKIVVAEDSNMMSQLIKAGLNDGGYKNIITFPDGKTIDEYIDKDPDVDLFILDIEMPYVNGFTLTKKIKESEAYRNKPVILFSSLINETNKNKGDKVGADYQISKPEIPRLIEIVDELLGKESF